MANNKKTALLFHRYDAQGRKGFWVVVVDKDKVEEFIKNYDQTEWTHYEEALLDIPEKYNN